MTEPTWNPNCTHEPKHTVHEMCVRVNLAPTAPKTEQGERRSNMRAVWLLRKAANEKGRMAVRMVRGYVAPEGDDDDDLDTIRFVSSRAWNLARSADELAAQEER